MAQVGAEAPEDVRPSPGATTGRRDTFTLYASDHTTAVYSEQVDANGNTTVGTTNGWVPTAAGTYYWVAGYAGDGNNVGVTSRTDDEPVTISKRTSTIATVIVDTNLVPMARPQQLAVGRDGPRNGRLRPTPARAGFGTTPPLSSDYRSQSGQDGARHGHGDGHPSAHSRPPAQ